MVGAHLLRPMSLTGSAMAPASVLLFDFEDSIRDGSQHGANAVPFELSAASAARTIDQLNWMLSPSNEEQRTVSFAATLEDVTAGVLPPSV